MRGFYSLAAFCLPFTHTSHMGVTALKLTQQQIEEFNTSGFLIARGALQDADLQPVIDELSTWIDQRARQLHS